ncbi:glycoside hydrolase family 79 protein [Marasmius fiardii PR-910]|nr:glycoside hydrolase family 79 protein [Marasmius fiardii PR-910]
MKTYLLSLITASSALAVTVNLANQVPNGAFAVSPSLFSLSIEQDRWIDWMGLNSRNEFFFNTLDNFVGITGEPLRLRIGANSEDHTNFNGLVVTPQVAFPPPTTTVPYPEASSVVVGDAYYKAARFLPPNTHVSWGVNFGSNNITAAVLEARSIAEAFSSPEVANAGIKLDFIEIGNEADLYRNNGFRSSSYTVKQYVPEWTTFAQNVSVAAGISSQSFTKFLGGSFAGSGGAGNFSARAIIDNGILSSQPGALITSISQHLYSGSFCSGSGALLQDLMTKSSIRSNLTRFTPEIKAVTSRNLEYVFGETNSFSCHGAPNVSNTAGAALWTLDYALFGRTINITRLYFHEGIGYKYNLIQPATLTRSTLDGSNLPAPLPPHVQPQYYAAIIAAEAIGKSGSTQLVELSVNDARVTGYAFYEKGVLVRAVFVNLQAWLSGTSGTRPSVHLDLNGSGKTRMTVKRLSISHADDASGLKWGGQSYETSDGRVSGTLSQQSAMVANGLDISATEAVLLSFS